MNHASLVRIGILALCLGASGAAVGDGRDSGGNREHSPLRDRDVGRDVGTAKLERLFRDRVALAIDPRQRIVDFRQLVFAFESGRVAESDWGRVFVDRARLAHRFGNAPAYVNVFFPAADRLGRTLWTVRNLYVPGAPDNWRGQTSQVAQDLDLRPGVDNEQGRVVQVNAHVLVSREPLPFVQASVDFATRLSVPRLFDVRPVLDDAEGDLGDAPERFGTSPLVVDAVSFGPPPQPAIPLFDLPSNFSAPVAVFQDAAPNIETAKNQCVPMAHANVIQYLENQVNIAPLSWNLPHAQVRGIGRVTAAGDTFTWQPVPSNSVIANVDTRTTRAGVFSADTGGGSDRCENIRGIMGYLNQSNLAATFRHQGGAEKYGSGGNCDSWIFSDVGNLSSSREGAQPTWAWIFEQLSLGRGVSISYSRYDISGNYTGGHMLRVWGASRINGVDYLHLLDDGDQGSNSTGLQLRQFEVADIGQPGLLGIPDGRLNINGGSAEIGFAISVDPVPSLALPAFVP